MLVSGLLLLYVTSYTKYPVYPNICDLRIDKR